MTLPAKFAAFIFANLLGYGSVHICYLIGVWSGVLTVDNPAFDAADFRTRFLTGTMMTWLVCAVFSLSFFVLKGWPRFIFLIAPAVIPMAYGLSVIAGLLPR